MGSKGRIPNHHMRHPLPGPGLVHPESFGVGTRPSLDGYPPHDMLPPPEILEQKLATQHMEMERIAMENQRLAATHGSLRQQLAAAQDELKMLESQVRGSKAEREQQMRGLMERISKIETELQAADRLKVDLQQARTEAKSLAEVRQELMSKVQQLNNELQRAHLDAQQIPSMMSELDHLRQEFHQYKGTFEHERKVYRDHLESLQAMDQEYRSMADEVEKLRAELSKTSNIDKRPVYGDALTHNSSVQSSYEDIYRVPQAQHTYPASSATAGAAVTASAAGAAPAIAATGVNVVTSNGGTPTYAGRNYAVGYDASRNPASGAQKGPAYDPQAAQVFNAQRTSGYDAYKGVYNNMQRPPYDPQRAAAYGYPQGNNYDAHSRGAAAPPRPQGKAPVNSMPHGSAARTSAGHETQPWGGGNTTHRESWRSVKIAKSCEIIIP